MSFYDSITLIVNILLIVAFLFVVSWFINHYRIRRLENRLGKYAVSSINDKSESMFDILINIYLKWRRFLNSLLYKSKAFKDYSNKYKKYIDKTKNVDNDPMNYVSTKVICAFVAIFLVMANDVFQNVSIDIYQVIIALGVGFFAPDIFLVSKGAIIKKEMEDSILKAITIMNNSFKSGRSIIQTIKIVSEEIDGPLQEEFNKMYIDLSYGLDIETVFARFSKRVKLDEVKYISTSLTILNKTGGNIVEVFSSIERTVFNNRKLKEELKNLTSSAKFLYRVLVFLPIVFTVVIYLMDSTYFNPFFTNPMGIIILITICIIYIAYIVIVKKTIRLREY